MCALILHTIKLNQFCIEMTILSDEETPARVIERSMPHSPAFGPLRPPSSEQSPRLPAPIMHDARLIPGAEDNGQAGDEISREDDDCSEDDDGEQGQEAPAEASDPERRTRKTRKRTYWTFVERPHEAAAAGITLKEKDVICKLGCLSRDGSTRLVFSGPNTGAVGRHVQFVHPQVYQQFLACKASKDNWNRLDARVAELDSQAMERIEKRRRHGEKLFSKLSDGLEMEQRSTLLLLMWSVANGVSRSALNCPLFDAYLRQQGAQLAPNRLLIQDAYLPKLDCLAQAATKTALEKADCVCLTADGWRDRQRRDWIDSSICWIPKELKDDKWHIKVAHPDLIPITASATAEAIRFVVNETIEDFVRDIINLCVDANVKKLSKDCLKATMTTDGAANERGAAALIVNEDNQIHCVAHAVQLVINDQLDTKRANPPPTCAIHREIVQKAHRLVVYVNGHRDTFNKFHFLAQNKKLNEEGARMFDSLVIDVETRWDSELALLERLIYFDAEILALYNDESFPPDMVFNRFEFDLAYAMTLVLQPFRIFTKRVQARDKVTFALVPGWIDQLVSQLVPGAFNARLIGRDERVREHVEAFQLCLIASMRARFGYLFESHSLALRATLLLPGSNRLQLENFPLSEEVIRSVKRAMVEDASEFLPTDMRDDVKRTTLKMIKFAIETARSTLDTVDEQVDPLEWWPKQAHLGSLFPLARMLLAIPATSADDERVFSSAGFILNQRRTRLDIENFRKEHRLRTFLMADGPGSKLVRANELLKRFAMEIRSIRAQEEIR